MYRTNCTFCLVFFTSYDRQSSDDYLESIRHDKPTPIMSPRDPRLNKMSMSHVFANIWYLSSNYFHGV
jgi:hypothetical protein